MTRQSTTRAPAAKAPLPVGWTLVDLDTVGSTNDEAKALALDGAAHGTVVRARRQAAGKARRGRRWESPPGNLYCSTVLRPDCSPAAAGQIAFAVALALAEAIAGCVPDAPPIRLKWPNDVLVRDRKVAGILLESALASDGAVDWVVVGTGVNIASHPCDTDYPATSLAAEGAPDVAPLVLLGAFAAALDHWHRRWLRDGFQPVGAAWRAKAGGLGGPVTVRLDRETVSGRFEDLDADGAMLLGLAGGGRRRITAGDVFFGDG